MSTPSHPLYPFPQHPRPDPAMPTLDSPCSLPWLRSRDFGPSPHLFTLLPSPLSSAKSSLNINQSSTQTELQRVSEPSPELRAQVFCECKQAETGSVNLPKSVGRGAGAPLHPLDPVGPSSARLGRPHTLAFLPPSPANLSPSPPVTHLRFTHPLFASPQEPPPPCSLLPPHSPHLPSPGPPPPSLPLRLPAGGIFSRAVKPSGSLRRHTCLRGRRRRRGGGSQRL